MFKNNFSLFPFKFILILWFIISINEVQPQTSVKRFTHSAHLIDNKLWIFGGGIMENGALFPTGDVFYVDLTKGFDTTKVQYVNQPASPFSCAWCQSAKGGKGSSTIFFFAGAMVEPGTSTLTKSIVQAYDINTQKWLIPKIAGTSPQRRRELQPVTDQNGKIYMFGGGIDMALGAPTVQVFDTMNVLDSIALEWSVDTTSTPPLPRIDYTATLLHDGRIVYVGGSQTNLKFIHFDNVDINQIYIYDTGRSTWSMMMATPSTGQKIFARAGHSAVLTKKNEIIIFGGVYLPNLVGSTPQVAVLNTATTPFQWSAPTVKNDSGINPPNLVFHTATLFNNYMIIAYGNKTIDEPTSGQSDQLYFLDIDTYAWVKTYTPTKPPPTNADSTIPTESPNSNGSSDATMIAVIVVAVVMIITGCTIAGVFYHRRAKQAGDTLRINDPHIVNQVDENAELGFNMHNRNIEHQRYSTVTSPDLRPVSQASSNLQPISPILQQSTFSPTLQQSNFSHGIQQSTFPPTIQQSNFLPNIQQSNFPPPLPIPNLRPTLRQNNSSSSSGYYDSDASIAPAHESFNVRPDQPFGVVLLNTESGEMIVPSNVQTTSNYNNHNHDRLPS